MTFVQRFGLIFVVAMFLMMTTPHIEALPPDFFRPVYVTVNYFYVGYFIELVRTSTLTLRAEYLCTA